MMNYDKLCITTPHFIVCEGADDKEYLSMLLKYIFDNCNYETKINIYSVDGISNFPRFFSLLPTLSNFHEILKTIIIVRDAESDPVKAKDSITNFLKKNKFAVPEKPCVIAEPNLESGENNIGIGYALFPNFDSPEPGTIEDLCLNTLNDPKSKELLEIVDNALETAKLKLNIDKFKKLHKNRLHTYLSLTDKFVSMKLGIAANSNAFNFSSQISNSEFEMTRELQTNFQKLKFKM